MTQFPYHSSGGRSMNPTSRFALFTVALLVIVFVGSQPRQGMSLTKSIDSMCVCVPARAGLIVKSAIAKTQAHIRSAELSTLRTTATR
jgi:hypothetical protein